MPIRITITTLSPNTFAMTVEFGGRDVKHLKVQDWQNFLHRKGWMTVRRVWAD